MQPLSAAAARAANAGLSSCRRSLSLLNCRPPTLSFVRTGAPCRCTLPRPPQPPSLRFHSAASPQRRSNSAAAAAAAAATTLPAAPLFHGAPAAVTAQSLEHSLAYLLGRERYAHAVALYTARPTLHTAQLSLRLLHALPYSPHVDCPFTRFALGALLELHRSRHLSAVDLDALYKQSVCRGVLPLASLCFRLLCAAAIIPPSLTELGDTSAATTGAPRTKRPPIASASEKAAVYARLMLLQTFTTRRLVAAAGAEVPIIVHAPITHTTLVLTAWCLAVQRRVAEAEQPPQQPRADEPMRLGEADVAVLEGEWHPFLWQQYRRALEHRKSAVVCNSTPLIFLPRDSLPPSADEWPRRPSSKSAVPLSDCQLLAEHMRFLSFLRSSSVLSNAPRLLFLSAHLLLYHLATLSALCRDAAVSEALLDAQLFIRSALLRRMHVEPTLLTVNCILSSWTSHLEVLRASPPRTNLSAGVTAATKGAAESARHNYAAFTRFFTSCFPAFVASAAVESSSHSGGLQPNADSLLPLVTASARQPQLSAADTQLVAHAARTALELRQKKLAVSSPALLLIEQPLRHIDALQRSRGDEHSSRLTGAAQLLDGDRKERTSEAQWDAKEWQRVASRARRGSRSACAAVVAHYLRSLDQSAQWWTASAYLDCSPAARLPTFRLLLHSTATACDLAATQTAWAHLLTLCPHPPRPLPWLYLSALAHAHLRQCRSPLSASHPPLSLSSLLSAVASLCRYHALPVTRSCRSLLLHVLLSSYLQPTSPAYAASTWQRDAFDRLRTDALLVRDMASRWQPGEWQRQQRRRARRRAVEGVRVDSEEWELSEFEREALLSFVARLQAEVAADEQLRVRSEWDRKARVGGVLQLPALAMQIMNLPHFPITPASQTAAAVRRR